MLSKYKVSVFPSASRLRFWTADASTPKLESFLRSAAVGWLSLSSPTDKGMSFWEMDLSAARSATFVTCAAMRRGEA